MALADIMVDAESGQLLVEGRVIIGNHDSTLCPPEHDVLALTLDERGMRTRPVTAVAALDNGFYRSVMHPLLVDLSTLQWPLLDQRLASKGQATLTYGGAGIGAVRYDATSRPSGSTGSIHSYQVRATLEARGIALSVSGVLTISAGFGDDPVEQPDVPFGIEAVLPWDAVIVREFHCVWSRSRYQGKTPHELPSDDVKDRRNPTRLADVMLDDLLGEPYVLGRMTVDGRNVRTSGQPDLVPGPIACRMDAASLTCLGTSKILRLDNGFVRGIRSIGPQLVFSTVGRQLLEGVLRSGRRLSRSTTGEGLGEFTELTGYAASDNGGRISQPMERLEVEAALDDQGLRVMLRGDLGPIEATSRGMIGGSDRGGRKFEVELIFSWGLLTVKGFDGLSGRRAQSQ